MPAGSEEREEPGGREGAVWVWKGPRTVPSVERGGLGWEIESTRMERPRMSERRMNSWVGLASTLPMRKGEGETYLSHVGAYLAHLGQEEQALHPLVGGEARLARKVVQVRDETLEDVFQTGVLAERVHEDGIVGDVVDGEVFHGGEVEGWHSGWVVD